MSPLERPFQTYRSAIGGAALLCFFAILFCGLTTMPKGPSSKGDTRVLFGGVGSFCVVGAIVMTAIAVWRRSQLRSFMAAEFARTGSLYYDIGHTKSVAGVQVVGTAVLSPVWIAVVVPNPSTGRGAGAGVVAAGVAGGAVGGLIGGAIASAIASDAKTH